MLLGTAISTIHAGVYGRQSEARENKSEASTQTQKRKGIEEAERRRADSITYYEDLGISAFSGAERPDFERLLADCRGGRINLLIVYYISRLSRMDPLEAIPIVTELLNLGVTIVSVTEGEFRKGNLMDLIHLIMRLHAAHEESKNKSVAVKGAKDTAKALGGYTGGKPGYGLMVEPETRYNAEGKPVVVQVLKPHPEEAKEVRRWVAYIKANKDIAPVDNLTEHAVSLSSLTRLLNEEWQTPTRGAKVAKERKASKWHHITVKKILRNPHLAGFATEVIYKLKKDGTKSTNIDRYRIVRDEKGEPVIACEAVIPPAEWYEIQAWLEGRNPGNTGPSVGSLFGTLGILFCQCGYRGSSHTNCYECKRPRGVTDVRPFADGTEAVPHAGKCSIGDKALEGYVAWRIMAMLRSAEYDPETLGTVAVAAVKFARLHEAPETSQERTALVMERADVIAQLDEMYETRKQGGYRGDRGRKAFREEEDALNDRLEAMEARIAALVEQETPTLPIADWLGEPDSDPIGPDSWWGTASLAERREFVGLFVRRIIFRKAPPGSVGSRLTYEKLRERVTIDWVGMEDAES